MTEAGKACRQWLETVITYSRMGTISQPQYQRNGFQYWLLQPDGCDTLD
jgi:hypothetical protein